MSASGPLVRRARWLAGLGFLLAWAVGRAAAQPAPTPPASPDDAALVSAGCTLCHVGGGLAVAPRVEACSGCHDWIHMVSANPQLRAAALTYFPKWERYEKNVRSYERVPSIEAAAARLEPGWVLAYLDDPHDLRPGLPESMPRFHLDAETRVAIGRWFAARTVGVPPGPAPDPANLVPGEALFQSRGCTACHAFGGRQPTAPNPAAPDLAHTRARMSPDRARAWILDPKALSVVATMPAMGLTPAEATAIRDYLFLADPGAPVAGAADVVHFVTAAGVSGPPPEAPTWADVEERVFGRICVHCHMDPAQNDGRRGPGNAGGFGWPETGIELQTYEGVVTHRDAILAALDRRLLEARRDCLTPGVAPASLPVPVKPGMPLGLPPLAAEDLALVKRWFAAGAPR